MILGTKHAIIPILIRLLIQEYINPRFILSIVIKKSNTMIINAKIEGIMRIIPNCPKSSALILCKPNIKPYNDKINPNMLHIIDIIFCILNNLIYYPPFCNKILALLFINNIATTLYWNYTINIKKML